jgi:hypothetical protein
MHQIWSRGGGTGLEVVLDQPLEQSYGKSGVDDMEGRRLGVDMVETCMDAGNIDILMFLILVLLSTCS